MPALRAEKLGQVPDSAKELIERVPEDLRNLPCPKCGALMVIVKANSDRMYTTYTAQCHTTVSKLVPREKGSLKVESICGLVIQLTDSVRNLLRPGDFMSHDIGWKDVAETTILLQDAAKILPKTEKFEGIKIKPEYPGQKKTINKCLFDEFWFLYCAHNGEVEKSELDRIIKRQRGDNPKTAEALRTFASMYISRTGYSIQLRNGIYTVVGRTIGAKGLLGQPYSDESYRKVHGFPA
jgi:predicted RNA-binding Zn-ribbon protein involved in translation (DUF1610 family)